MKRFIRFIDPFIAGGFVGSLFAGSITPHQLKLTVSALEVRVLTLGSLAASMLIFGVVTSTVMYLLQITKQRRYRRRKSGVVDKRSKAQS